MATVVKIFFVRRQRFFVKLNRFQLWPLKLRYKAVKQVLTVATVVKKFYVRRQIFFVHLNRVQLWPLRLRY